MSSSKQRLLQNKELYLLVLVSLMIFLLFSCNRDKAFYDSYDFIDHFKDAEIQGLLDTPKNANPWGKTVARIEIEQEKGKSKKSGIFSVPPSVLSYSVKISSAKNVFFIAALGFHPVTRMWNSDGVRMKVEVIKDNIDKVIVDKYVMPKDGFINVEVPLSEFAGGNVIVKFSSTNDQGKNGDGDWPVWLEPKIISR